MHNKIITIGHASHDISRFVKILEANQVETVIDTRQFPVSRHNPQFNRAKISKWLLKEGFQYVFLGNGLGNIQEKILTSSIRLEEINANSPEFRAFSHDLGKLMAHINAPENIAILGTKGAPFECPRFYQLAPLLQRLGFSITHILENGQAIPNWQLEIELVKKSINCDLKAGPNSDQALQLAYQTHRAAMSVKSRSQRNLFPNGPPGPADGDEGPQPITQFDLAS